MDERDRTISIFRAENRAKKTQSAGSFFTTENTKSTKKPHGNHGAAPPARKNLHRRKRRGRRRKTAAENLGCGTRASRLHYPVFLWRPDALVGGCRFPGEAPLISFRISLFKILGCFSACSAFSAVARPFRQISTAGRKAPKASGAYGIHASAICWTAVSARRGATRIFTSARFAGS